MYSSSLQASFEAVAALGATNARQQYGQVDIVFEVANPPKMLSRLIYRLSSLSEGVQRLPDVLVVQLVVSSLRI